jgi:hypothetical protein
MSNYTKRKSKNGTQYYDEQKDYSQCSVHLTHEFYNLESIFYNRPLIWYDTKPNRDAVDEVDKAFVSDFIHRLLLDSYYISKKVNFLNDLLEHVIGLRRKDNLKVTDKIECSAVIKELRIQANISKRILNNRRYNLSDSDDYRESILLLSFLQFLKKDMGLIKELERNFNEEILMYARYTIKIMKEIYCTKNLTNETAIPFRFLFLLGLAGCANIQNSARLISDNNKFIPFISDLIANINDLQLLPSFDNHQYIFALFVQETMIRYKLGRFMCKIEDQNVRAQMNLFKIIQFTKCSDLKNKKKKKRKKSKKNPNKKERPIMVCNNQLLTQNIANALKNNTSIPIDSQLNIINKCV